MRLVYITRFAFSKGIIITTIPHDKGSFMYDLNALQIGKDAFLTIEDARAKVEEMRERRIKEHQDKIEKLRNTEVIVYGQETTTDIDTST